MGLLLAFSSNNFYSYKNIRLRHHLPAVVLRVGRWGVSVEFPFEAILAVVVIRVAKEEDVSLSSCGHSILTGDTMKNIMPLIFFFSMLLTCSIAFAAGSSEPAPLLPESLAARAEMAADQKTVTIFFLQEDPVKATAQLNASNDEYAQKGWNVFTIIPYVKDEDFKGFFVTYQKNLILN